MSGNRWLTGLDGMTDAEVLRFLLTEECDGRCTSHTGALNHAEDCDGRVPKGGVRNFTVGAWRCNSCGRDCRADGPGCNGSDYDDRHYLLIPTEMLGLES